MSASFSLKQLWHIFYPGWWKINPLNVRRNSKELKCCQKTGGNFTALWRCGHFRKRDLAAFGDVSGIMTMWNQSNITLLHLLSSTSSPDHSSFWYHWKRKGHGKCSAVSTTVSSRKQHLGSPEVGRFAKGQICKSRGRSSQWQGIASFLQYMGNIPLIRTHALCGFISLYLKKILNILSISPDSWCKPTMPSEDWTAALTVDSWCCLDGLFHWLLYWAALF